MTKEILLSIFIHIGVISIVPIIKLAEKSPPTYPMTVYQVSIKSLPTLQPVTQVGDKKPRKEGKKDKKSEKDKPKSTSKQSGNSSGLHKGPISTEGVEFKYSWYLEIVLSKISENWHNPYEGSKISAVVYFVINRDGTIDKVRLDKSSKNYYFDQSAIGAVQATKKLPPLPQEFDRPSLGVYFEFEYVE